jgi:serine/threonine protein kinase/alpha-tubulin suppressor-like RCC1 family protein
MSSEPFDGESIPSGAAFVASSGGTEYFWVGSADWFDIPPLERVWFPTEQAAREAGYQPSSRTFEKLDEFEMLGEIGRGGTSIVYHARDSALGREVAIKVVQACFRNDPENLARFAQEARLLAGLRHPNIVSAFSVKQLRGGGLALVMEYIRGPTLREVLRADGAVPVERAEQILREVGGALSAAHARGIVHRDVKPDNIFLEEPTGRTLLADFGIATHLDSPSGLTMVGTAVGTPNYMSPEQIDGQGIDGRSDLYSLALIGWEMLAGVKPWAGESLYGVIYKQKHDTLPSLHELRPDVPLRLVFAIEGALAKNPNERWTDADEFLASLSDETLQARWRRWSTVATQRRKSARIFGASPASDLDSLESMETVRLDRSLHAGEMPKQVSPVPAPSKRPQWVRPAAVAGAILIALAGAAAGLRQSIVSTDTARANELGEDPAAEVASESPPPPDERPTFGTELGLTGFDPRDAVVPSDSAVAVEDDLEGLTVAEADTAYLDESAAEQDEAAEEEATGEEEAEEEVVEPVEEEIEPLPIARSRSRVATGGMHSCGLNSEGSVVCWGGNDAGQLGTGGGGSGAGALALAGAVTAVEAGAFHTCALNAEGTAFCWGENREGQLGDGGAGTREPAAVPNARFYSLSLGTGHTCGVASDGGTYCWGSNAYGQLGDGTRSSRASPRLISTSETLTVLAAGWNHSCGLTRQGEAACWGRNEGGQLGDGSTTDRTTPVRVSGGSRFRSIAAGSAHTCALSTAGQAYCWGQNADGRLGDGSTVQRRQPTPVRASVGFVEISAGGRHTCALTSSGAAYCWGQNNYGQLGTGDTNNRNAPTRVWTDIVFSSIRSSGAHTCGVAVDGATYCWGYNVEGQVGDGTRTHRTIPYRVERSSAAS